jgi:DNA-binding LytR/AlgR family response regulator
MVAICDDEIKIGAELERALIDIFDKLNVKYEIDVYFAGEALHQKMETGTHYDLIFLDIEFAKNEINGVEVGRLIRNAHQNNAVSIVYVSWEKKYAMDLFKIRPLDFLIKPVEYDKIEQVIRTYFTISKFLSEEFVYKKGHDTFKLRLRDIVYLESRGRKLIIHLSDGRAEECYGSLKEVYEEQLKRFDFLFVHASFVVNYDYVSTVKRNQVLLLDNVTPFLPIAQNKWNEVAERYCAIIKRRRV